MFIIYSFLKNLNKNYNLKIKIQFILNIHKINLIYHCSNNVKFLIILQHYIIIYKIIFKKLKKKLFLEIKNINIKKFKESINYI